MAQRLEAQGRKDSAKKWDHGSDHDDVAKICVRCDSEGIEYIQFCYIKNGQPRPRSFHYVNFSGFTHTFELNHLKGEQLESVEGYYEPKSAVIQGIQFRTNLRISELIGYEKNGTKFSLAVDGKKIIGFHGSFDSKPSSLGAYFSWFSPTKMEAKGGKGGKEWNDGANHEGVAKIYVRGGLEGIQYIKLDYVKNGQHIYGLAHGMRGKGYTETFEINHIENEYLVSVEGYYDDEKSGVLQGIQFNTNIKTSGLMGVDKGMKFSIAANGKKIIGFHGCAEKNLNSLGAYFTASSFTKLELRDDATLGDLWNDGVFEGIRKVCVYYDNFCVRCLRVNYESGGKEEILEHGSTLGKNKEFSVDYPNEFITSVEGTLETTGSTRVTSLILKTSKGRTSPKFGSATDIKFVLESKGCALVGFHGRSGRILSAIGAYFRPLPPPTGVEKREHSQR